MPQPIDVLETAMETAHIGLARTDVEGRFVSINEEYLLMLGYAGAEELLIGQSWRTTVHPEDHSRAEEAYRLAHNEGRGYIEIRGLCRDRRIVYQALTVVKHVGSAGELCGYQCLRQNISQYKREQAAMMVAIETAPHGLLLLNSAGCIQLANAAVERFFGYSRFELAGLPLEAL